MSYSESYFTARESWRDWRIEARELIRLAQVHRGARVLEIGCGGGGLLRMLDERGASVVGADTLETALDLAKKQLGAEIRVQLIRISKNGMLPFRDAAFDAIIGQHVIEHLPDVNATLYECNRVLKPNGRIALATPNARYPDPAHFADADHTHVFTPRQLRDAVEGTGLAVESCFTIFPFLTRARLLRAAGIIAYNVFRYAPYFSVHGRTIMLSARKH